MGKIIKHLIKEKYKSFQNMINGYKNGDMMFKKKKEIIENELQDNITDTPKNGSITWEYINCIGLNSHYIFFIYINGEKISLSHYGIVKPMTSDELVEYITNKKISELNEIIEDSKKELEKWNNK